MKASELRIGNLVLCEGEVATVQIIHGRLNIVVVNTGERDWCNNPDKLQPIPLTDAVLEAINGELKELIASECELGVSAVHIHMTTDGFSIAKCGDIYAIKRPFRCTPLATFSSLQVEHLHQLQNLYHALTGNELEIDETKLKQSINQ